MASSTIDSLLYSVRANLKENTTVPGAYYWNDAELLDWLNRGAKDLWRAIVDLYEHHFLTISDAPFIEAGANIISAIPDDVYRIVLIEPRTIGQSSVNPGLVFKPLPYQDPRFLNARACAPISPREAIVYYDQVSEGAPVGPPAIRIGPTLSSSMLLTVAYNHTIGVFDETDTNPIPGESDNALIAWATAFARGKERDDTAPDPAWLKVYASEKANLIKQIGPRQIQEAEFADGMFEGYDF